MFPALDPAGGARTEQEIHRAAREIRFIIYLVNAKQVICWS